MSSPSAGSSAASGGRPKVNLRSTAVKRIMQEASELSASDINDDFVAAPLESDIFEWHVTMRGTPGSEFEGGLYHLRILLPPTYPMSAPDIMLMTPNGRFELGKKICIDGLTSFHAGSWQPAWGVRTAVLGLRSFWMQGGEALSAIGALDYSKEERKRLAKLSHEWECPQCGRMKDQIPEPALVSSANSATAAESSPKSESAEEPSSTSREIIPTVSEPEFQKQNGSGPSQKLPPSEEVRLLPSEQASPGTTLPPAPTPTSQDPLDSRVAGPDRDHTIAARVVAVQVRQPAPSPLHRQAPVWIDLMIVVGVAILVGLLYRKIGNSSNLIETVSL